MQDLRFQFLLDTSITYLNHGSFGACPRSVFEKYQAFQLELEREPAQFIQVNGPRYLKESRDALGKYIGCDGDDVVYVSNPTYAVNVIAKGLDLKPGDEVLTTNLEYGACDRTWSYYCGKAGAKYVRAAITLPLVSKEQFLDEFWKGFSAKTKAIFISQITSSTALILPVKEICAEARKRGLFIMVDGAHVPSHIPLDLRELETDAYTGACHKWTLTPKGSSFLYLKKSYQEKFDPAIISWGYESDHPSHSRFLDYHQMNGTRDFSAFLTIPAALQFLEEHNWTAVSDVCKKLVLDNYQKVCDVIGTKPVCPVTSEFLGQMCSTPINTKQPMQLQRHLFEKFSIEIPIMVHSDKTFIRFSINAYNSQEDIDKLINALQNIDKSLLS